MKRMKNAPWVFKWNNVVVLCYGDDLLVMGISRKSLANVYRPKTSVRWIIFWASKLSRSEGNFFLKERKTVEYLLSEMSMDNCSASPFPMDTSTDYNVAQGDSHNATFPYWKVIGKVLYLSTRTGPVLSVAVSVLACHVESPTAQHCDGIRKMLRYLQGTEDLGLVLRQGQVTSCLHMWIRSGAASRPVVGDQALAGFGSTLPKCVSLSPTEAEYVALSEATKKISWLRCFLMKLVYCRIQLLCAKTTVHEEIDFKRLEHINIR